MLVAEKLDRTVIIMIIQIDYLAVSEQVIISNDSSNDSLWNSFRNFICDYLPAGIIDFSPRNMIFPWRYFLSLKTYIAQYASAHKTQLKIAFTDAARSMIKNANSVSYQNAISAPKRSKTEIESILTSKGFARKLTNNQIDNLEKISALPGAATFSVPGAGKTTEALAFFFVNCTDSDRLLVVAPKNAFGAWDEQLEACFPEKSYEMVRLRGGEGAIAELLKRSPRFMIISYDQLPRVTSLIADLLSSGNVYMFLDESHRIKGGKQVKRAESVLSMAHLPKRKLIMSGTPMPQGPQDLLSQFTFLYPTKDIDENSVIDLIQPLYVRTNKGQLGIPEVTHNVVTVKMGALQREIYDTLKSEVRRQFNPVLSDLSKYELKRIGKSIIKVMEFVSNPALLANDMEFAFDQRVGQLLLSADGPKIDYVCRRARELASQGKKSIIWSCFVQNVELIALRLNDLGAEYIHGGVDAGDESEMDTREGKIKRFHDDPSCMVLVANPAACSEGISLHKVCQNAIYLDRSFNAAHYLQSEDRIHRLGLAPDAHPVVEFVECENSIDQVVRERLAYKVRTMADTLNDSSLKVDPNGFEYDQEDTDENELNMDDAKAIIAYFFSDYE